MPADDVLLMMAQLGVAIAGFNGIVAAVDRGERRSIERRVMSSVLVTAAASVIAWSVVPLVLLAMSIPAERVWQGSSLGWAAAQTVIMVFRQRQARRLGLVVTRTVAVFMGAVLAALVLQLWNAIFAAQAWPHLVGLAVSLLVAMGSFFLLVHDGEDEPEG